MADSSWSTTAASRWRAAITLYIGSSSSDSSREDRFRFVFEDVATECTTTQIRNAVGRTTITESAIHAGRCAHGNKSEHTEQKWNGIGKLVQGRCRKFWPR